LRTGVVAVLLMLFAAAGSPCRRHHPSTTAWVLAKVDPLLIGNCLRRAVSVIVRAQTPRGRRVSG
jgi:hypothetical protein